MRKTLCTLALFTSIVGIGAGAAAQGQGDSARCAETSNSGGSDRDHTYCFGGEDVPGSLVGHQGQNVQAMRHMHGPSLLRLRAHFVPEMLKSVESF